jgi:enoyl-CoA hydratase/carnithine racemase
MRRCSPPSGVSLRRVRDAPALIRHTRSRRFPSIIAHHRYGSKSARDRARAAAAMPPTAVRLTKETVNAAANALLHLGSHMEADQFAFLTGSEEARAARARFTQRSKA